MIRNRTLCVGLLVLVTVTLLATPTFAGYAPWVLPRGGRSTCTMLGKFTVEKYWAVRNDGPETVRVIYNEKEREIPMRSTFSFNAERAKVCHTRAKAQRTTGAYKVTDPKTSAQLTAVGVPALTGWGIIGLGVALAGGLAWVIRRKIAYRPANTQA